MSRIYLYFLLVLLPAMFFSGAAVAQKSYVDGLLYYKITVSYDDHQVVAHVKPAPEITVSSDRNYYWFASSHIHVTQGGYSDKLLNGDYEDFYLNKNLKESGTFTNGLKSGRWKNWTEEGLLIAEFSFEKGKKNGDYIKYDAQGKAIEKGAYQNDLLNGKQEKFRADSTIVLYYKAGKIKHRKSFLPKLPPLPKFMKKIFPQQNADAKKPAQN